MRDSLLVLQSSEIRTGGPIGHGPKSILGEVGSRIYFCDVFLGRIDERNYIIRD
jgi:hypothetical protein